MENVALWNAGCSVAQRICWLESQDRNQLSSSVGPQGKEAWFCWECTSHDQVYLPSSRVSTCGILAGILNTDWQEGGRRRRKRGRFLFLGTELGCQSKLQRKKSHFFPRKNSDKDSKLDEQCGTVVLEWQELILAKAVVRAGFPFPFYIHISLMLLSKEGAGKSSRKSNSPFCWVFLLLSLRDLFGWSIAELLVLLVTSFGESEFITFLIVISGP